MGNNNADATDRYYPDRVIPMTRAKANGLHDGQNWTIKGLVFCDFDGVLHPYVSGPFINDISLYNDFGRKAEVFHLIVGLRNQERGWPHLFSSIDPLVQLLEERKVGLVINTSWRRSMSLQEIIDVLPDSLARWVVGRTRTCAESTPQGDHMPGARSDAIADWLKASRLEELPWGALDDVEVLHNETLERLILTDGKTGLTPSDMQRLAALLQSLPS